MRLETGRTKTPVSTATPRSWDFILLTVKNFNLILIYGYGWVEMERVMDGLLDDRMRETGYMTRSTK
jgi:hypothetical protein